MLLKFCPQWASKFGKFSSGHRNGDSQFSFQFQRKVMPKNVQTTMWLYSFCMIVRLCSKSFKLVFSSITIKKAECQRNDAFKLWCWRRILRVTWTARSSNQWILKEINPEYSLEGLMLKLKLQYFGHLPWRPDLLEKTLILGEIEGRWRRGG